MKINILSEALKYFDCFGSNFTFYTEKNRKFYTQFGGILTLLSIIVGILVFIFMNIDDFFHNTPISTASTVFEKHRNIKFVEEKIWIPWRVRDYNSKTVNFSGLFYPIIYYYKGIKTEAKNSLDLSYSIINYSLCNETSMANYSNSFVIDQLYCIDMDELDMGGSWEIDFINYVEFDLYSCKDGIDYDENNPNCSSYEKIINFLDSDNSFEIEIFYPIVHYQPMNKTTPIFVRYANYFYHLSRFSNKIDRIYLQQYILNDDTGWILKKEKRFSHWGSISLNGDSYATGDKRDLMNEGSSSRFYSFNIYLKSDVVYYNRSYKKLFLIIANGLPIVNVIFIIFKLFTKIVKISSGNKKLTELLFENLQEKQNKIKNGRISVLKLNKKKINSEKKFTTPKNINKTNINTTNNNINDASSIQISSQYEGWKKAIKGLDIKRFSIDNKKEIRNFQKANNQYSSSNNDLLLLNRSINNNLKVNYGNVGVNNNNININISNNNIGDFTPSKSNELSSMINFNKSNRQTKYSSEDNNNIINNSIKNTRKKTYYIKKKLFPYKYYLCSIFIKNIDISKKSIFFTKKFIVVYNFICQLFDISSYLILQREFQILKGTLMLGKYRAVLENRQKINVNDHSFNTDMKKCLDSQQFSILARI